MNTFLRYLYDDRIIDTTDNHKAKKLETIHRTGRSSPYYSKKNNALQTTDKHFISKTRNVLKYIKISIAKANI